MALIYEIQCDTCYFAESLFDRLLFAVCEDGSEIALSHPGENDKAWALTGMTLRQLDKLDRLRKRDGYVCLSCGTTGFYAERNGGFEGTDDDSPLGAPLIATRTAELRCVNCYEEALETAGGPNMAGRAVIYRTGSGEPAGCLLMLAISFGLTKPIPQPALSTHPCPQCHTGRIQWKCAGIT